MSIRLRLACIVALTAAVLVAAAGIGLAAELRSGIGATLRDSLRQRVVRVGRDLSSGSLPLDRQGTRVPLARDQSVVQVLGLNGVVEYSTEASGEPSLLDRAQLGAARRGPIFVQVMRPRWHNPRLVLAEPAPVGRREVLLVGASLDEVDHSIVLLEDGIAIGGPVVVLLVGIGGWLIAGRALHPVERLRAEAEELSESGSAHGLVVPSTHDELERLAKTLNGLLGRLHGALSEQKMFVAAASHELRTPLAAVRAELEVASMPGATDVERRQALEVLGIRIDQIIRLTRDLLLLAVGDERTATLELVVQPVEPLVAASLQGLRHRADSCGVALVLDADPGVACTVDAEHFRRVIDNLVENALAHGAGSPMVEVSVRHVGGRALIEVRDAGPGFPDWFLPHAFDRFSRAEMSRRDSEGGAGLGLAIVKSLVDAHGGIVTVANRPEGGAVVRVELVSLATADNPKRSPPGPGPDEIGHSEPEGAPVGSGRSDRSRSPRRSL